MHDRRPMTEEFVKFNQVSYQYNTMNQSILKNVTLHFEKGWTGVVGANGSGKTTLLKLALKEIVPDSGVIETPGQGVYCDQRTDKVPLHFKSFVESWDHEAFALRGQLQIDSNWVDRWDSLSHGERKRAQIATVLWQQPAIIAIDEPTNHIDRHARLQLIHSLKNYQGVGLIVSHDRELLEILCEGNVFLINGEALYQPGSYSIGKAQIEQEFERQRKKWDQTYNELKKLKKRAGGFRSDASHANQKRSKKGIPINDHDAKSKIDAARVSGKDALAGKALNQLQGRIQQTDQKLKDISVKKQFQMGIEQKGIRSQRNTILNIPKGQFLSYDQLTITHSGLTIQPSDKIAITGNNGSGKSTLITHLIGKLAYQSDEFIYLPQEIPASTAESILAEVKTLSNKDLGEIMTIIRRLGSNPGQLLESQLPSPGELRKLLIALGVVKKPVLMILDEPTNHLDLPSIECLESTLIGFEAALIIVSHDQQFLNKTTNIKWQFNKFENTSKIDVIL